MVTKQIIEEVINKSIYKSHQHLTIRNNNVKKVLNDFAHSTRNRKTEKGLFITSSGEIAFSKNGSKRSVSFTENEIKDTYKEYGELHIEHNHPDMVKNVKLPYTETLSMADMNLLTFRTRFYDDHNGWGDYEYPFKSITAEGTNGSRMTLVRGDYFTEENHEDFDNAMKKLNKEYVNYQELYSNTRSDFLHKISANDFDSDDEWRKQLHKETINKIGDFEDSREFKSIQKDFRNANMRLTVEWIDL